jgi:hypothetical protein
VSARTTVRVATCPRPSSPCPLHFVARAIGCVLSQSSGSRPRPRPLALAPVPAPRGRRKQAGARCCESPEVHSIAAPTDGTGRSEHSDSKYHSYPGRYQRVLGRFGAMGRIELSPPAPTADLVLCALASPHAGTSVGRSVRSRLPTRWAARAVLCIPCSVCVARCTCSRSAPCLAQSGLCMRLRRAVASGSVHCPVCSTTTMGSPRQHISVHSLCRFMPAPRTRHCIVPRVQLRTARRAT